MVRRREYHWLVFLVVALLALLAPAPAHAGYTHYWRWKIQPDKPRLERAVAEMGRIVDSKRAILDVGDAGGQDEILFNGIGDEGHEAFGFPLAPFAGKPEFNFVKTAMKPYDAVVTACLIVARDHFMREELEISSDGTWDGWRAGRDLYIAVLERQANDPMEARPHGLDDEDDDEVPGPSPRAPEPKNETSRLRAVGISLGVIGALVVLRLLMGGRA
jgi:hypothetical protein